GVEQRDHFVPVVLRIEDEIQVSCGAPGSGGKVSGLSIVCTALALLDDLSMQARGPRDGCQALLPGDRPECHQLVAERAGSRGGEHQEQEPEGGVAVWGQQQDKRHRPYSNKVW